MNKGIPGLTKNVKWIPKYGISKSIILEDYVNSFSRNYIYFQVIQTKFASCIAASSRQAPIIS